MFPKLWKAWRITHLVFEKDTDTYGKGRDAEVMRLAREANVQVVTKVGRTLYDPEELIRKNGGKPTMTIMQVEHVSSFALYYGPLLGDWERNRVRYG